MRNTMSTKKPLEDRVTQLLWRGKVSQAKLLLATEGSNIKKLIEEAEKKLLELKREQKNIIRLNAGRDSEETKKHRNKVVIDLAKLIAINGVVRTNILEKRITSENIEMLCADNRRSTVISNILLRTGNFEKLASGLYRVPD